MRKKHRITIGIVLGVLFLDQASKLYIDETLALHHSIQIVDGFVHITHVRNTGAAFGFLSGQAMSGFRTVFLISVSCVAVLAILFFLKSLKDHQVLLISGLSMVMGGAVGNLLDRIRLGEVIDFIDLHWHAYHWPTFNVADSAITIGGIFLIIDIVFRKGES